MRTCKECNQPFVPRVINGIRMSRCNWCLVKIARGYRAKPKVEEKKIRKQKTLAQLIKIADTIFSLFIRLRDRNQCITCGTIDPGNMQNGHYIPRGHKSTRYSEINCNAQCKNCNEYNGGATRLYRERLISKYGIYAVLDLEAKKYTFKQFTAGELSDLIAMYKQKYKQLWK